MKTHFLSLSRGSLAVLGLVLGLALLACGSAKAVNPVLNPGFESLFDSFGVTNWTIEYIRGGPSDFACKGRSTAARNGSLPTGVGAGFQPWHDGLLHAYFKQTVSGLIAGATYAVTNWVNHPGDTNDQPWQKTKVYVETVGGLGSVQSPVVSTVGWQPVVVTNTATTNGQIEIRLHMDKFVYTVDKWPYINAWFDDISMTLISAPPTPTNAPYKILSFTRTDQTVTFKWESVSNQLYSILASPDLLNWSTFQTNLLATGTNLTFTTNAAGNDPLFFRIHRP